MGANDDQIEEADLYPTWLNIPRGFVDMRAVEATSFNDLVTNHLNVGDKMEMRCYRLDL